MRILLAAGVLLVLIVGAIWLFANYEVPGKTPQQDAPQAAEPAVAEAAAVPVAAAGPIAPALGASAAVERTAVEVAAPPLSSTLGDYPPEWHSASDSIHVYGSGPARTIEMSDDGQPLLDVVFGLGQTSIPSSVVVFRRTGSDTIRIEIDVRDMLVTGNTKPNILLRPGDVVAIAS